MDRRSLRSSITALYRSRLIDVRDQADGSIKMILADAWRSYILQYKLDELTIPRKSGWDGKWRVVLFDVPENRRKIRDAFRHHLIRLGFFELQKSVFVYPYECRDEIEFLIEFFHARPYVRFLVAERIDIELQLRRH